MRHWSLLALAVIVSLSLLACGSPAPTATPALTPTTAAVATPTPAGEATSTPIPPTATPAPPQEYRLSLATTPAPSSFYAIGVTLAEIMTKYTPSNITVGASGLPGGSPAHYTRLDKNEIDIGVGVDGSIYQSTLGPSPDHPDMRVLFYNSPTPNIFIVREDSGITKPQDLQGKKFGIGILGSTTAQLAHEVLTALGVKADESQLGGADLVAATKDGKIVGFVKGAPMNSADGSFMELKATTQVKVLNFTEEQLDAVSKAYPHWNRFKVPSGVYDGEILTPSFTVGWAVHKRMPEDVAYKLVKAAVENHKELEALYTGLKGLGDIGEFTMGVLGEVPAPLHPGAVRYFRERGFSIPDKALPPEMS